MAQNKVLFIFIIVLVSNLARRAISTALEAAALRRTISRTFRKSAHDADGSTVRPIFADKSSIASDGLHAHSLELAYLRCVPPGLRKSRCHFRARLCDGTSDELFSGC